ncbi:MULTISPECIES: aspartate aminotransferase family protein [Bosea]|uniref:(R)-1-hydroxy-2-aminoethylphosphonate ammonia-lyase n=1 Tax=Bosea TaxID=85413 RepID=UPI00214FFD6B|nr:MULTISPECIES: aspartate aminotransferase family protein [Bosea]MCR4520668.1 aspartate aminotransferase family protein [Bosea sp. 47.2.35]MDR6828390.1 4-aminobutyrate aminotransferase [Bosea robiniae]MDR6895049.1 4-aminobutyrate aminotransferase [Bosea sp. BE109]MDR7138385.1 4-aminobutyrate aminotransferase [Bosea sp. BE168]MDR7175084.1 4-aminobutyrate aminotransferase [Bosea sp. BE271]
MRAETAAIVHTEGESNTSAARSDWSAGIGDAGTRALLARDSATFLHQSLSSPCLTAIAKAEGIWIADTMGRRYMDFHGNSVHHIGYGHPRLKEAIKAQLDDLCFAPRRFTCEPAVELAETLGRLAPGDLGKVLFTTGGSDAIEVALRLARAATGRFKTLSFWDAFHGAGFGASSVGGEATFRSGIAGPLLPGAEHVAPWGTRNCAYGHDNLEDSARACARMISYVLAREGDVAAVVAEPMRATPYPPAPGFWKSVREACDRHGTLLIFDEIPTGLGKTGRFFAHEHDEVQPDMVVLGKALGGGILPIAAVVARRDLDVVGGYAIGHYTHEKNPVTTRAALTTINIIREEGLTERAAELGAHAIERLRHFGASSPAVGDVRGRGLLFGVELVSDRDAWTPDNALAERVYYRCLEAGLSFKISQGNVLTLSPPMVIARADLERALGIVEQAILAG